MNILFYISIFFSFFFESFALFSFSKIKSFQEDVESSESLQLLELIKGDIREHVGTVLAFAISFIWLTLFSIILSFFYTTLGLSLTLVSIAGFVYFLNLWRYMNGLGDLCINKKHELESK